MESKNRPLSLFSMLKRQYRIACPINVTDANVFDYRGTLQTILDARKSDTLADFSGYFRHVKSVSLDALAVLSRDLNNVDKLGYKY